MTLGDRIVIMKDGYIMQVGSPGDVFYHPGNLFVAEFIGAPKMNTFKAELVKEDGEYYVKAFGSKLIADGKRGEDLKAKGVTGQQIILGVRPEHMFLASDGDPNAIECTLEVSEMMGSELHLHAITDDGTRLIVRVQTINLTPEQRKSLEIGKRIRVTFEGKVMHFFDAETEENILYPYIPEEV